MKLHIIAAIVDTKVLTLYLKDGTTFTVKQGDPQLAIILEKITDDLITKKEAIYEFEAETAASDFVDFSAKTGDQIKFYKINKETLSKIFSGEVDIASIPEVKQVPPTQIGSIDSQETIKTKSVVAEIIANADVMTDDVLLPGHTVVAVVDDVAFSGVENLAGQVANANKQSSTGLEKFMKRIATVASMRRHATDDLMRFMQKGDLPIADDGSIVIYKILVKTSDKEHPYRDCHSKNVPQAIGSYVCMDESMVDPDRRVECSNGLHVARRGYLNSFSGDVCVIAKVAPEDVIAVPSYDSNKMRVRGYHILFELPTEAFQKLKANTPMTDNPTCATILGKVLVGDHVGKLEEVHIGGPKGTNISIKKLMTDEQATNSLTNNDITSVDSKAEAIEEVSLAPQAISLDAPVVLPTTVVKDVAGTKETIQQLPTRKEKAADLYKAYLENKTDESLTELQKYKTSCKCSWGTLGLPDLTPKTNTKVAAKTTKAVTTKVVAVVSNAQKAIQMMKNIRAASSVQKKVLAKELVEFKKKKKVGYDVLGLNKKDVDLLIKLTK